MSDALKRVESQILAAVPAYETYFLQVMGKPFRMKPPLFRTTPEKFRVMFDSVEHANGAHQTPERLVLWIELNRAMGTCTVSTEWWQDTKELEPTARGESKVDVTPENLMAPAFAFGWLHKLVGGWAEGIEGDDMERIEEVKMEQAELLIVKADEILAEMGYVIEADSYESYANTLDKFLLTARLDEQVEGVLSKVGSVVRKAAHAYGAVKGGVAGASARWKGFKASVGAAYKKGHDKGFKAARGDSGGDEKPASSGGAAPKGKGKGKAKLKLVKGGGKGKMTDKEYKARYGKSRGALAASLDVPESDLEELMGRVRGDVFEAEFNSLDIEGLLALEELVVLMRAGSLDEKASGKFAALVKKLKMREGAVRDPEALAAWIGRKKHGAEPFQKMAAAGREEVEETSDAEAVSSYQRLSGLTMPMRSWSLPKLK